MPSFAVGTESIVIYLTLIHGIFIINVEVGGSRSAKKKELERRQFDIDNHLLFSYYLNISFYSLYR